MKADRDGHSFVEFNNMVTPYTNRLFVALRARGHRLAILSCTRKEANRDWGEVESPYPHQLLPGVSFPVGPRRIAHLNSGIGRSLQSLAPGALVINGFYPSMLVAAIWARRHHVPLALRIDGGANDMPDTPYHRIVRRYVLSQCRAVLVCGTKGRSYFATQNVPDERIFDMPIVPAWDPPARVAAWGERSHDVLWAAELDDTVKNLSFFRDVVLALHARRPDLTVRVLGRGKDAALLDALRAGGVTCLHEPRRDWNEMSEVFASSRILMLPSRREPWGLVCNEAMQCGTVCMVSPHVGAADDLVTAANGVVAELDVERWAHIADELLHDPQRWSLLSQAARQAAGIRTIDKAADVYDRMIRSMIAA